MRIVTWNCQMGLIKKADALLSLNPDVAVVPECSEKSAIAFRQHGYETLWFGSNPHKGLGVFCRAGWPTTALPLPKQKWIAPIRINAPKPFILLAVWAQASDDYADRYIRQLYLALKAHPDWFDGMPVVLAGDLNSNKIWDGKRDIGSHSDVVRILAEQGLMSVYHEHFSEVQGAETRHTFYLHRHAHRPYHIDYIFVPRTWAARLKAVDVGLHQQWSNFSDHCPLSAEFEPNS